MPTQLADISYPTLNATQGTDTADYLLNKANAAADAVCSLYQNYPSGIIPSLGDPTGIGEFTDGLLRNLCGPRDKLPADPTRPFEGGQCACVTYNVTVTVDGPLAGTRTYSGLNGPISNVAFESSGGNQNLMITYGSPACGGVQKDNVLGPIGGSSSHVTGVSIVRSNGSPDTCGSLPVKYPEVIVPPSVYSPNITIKGPGGNVSVPVTIIPTLIRPTVNFRPEINVKVGPINVNFNLGGVDFSVDNSGGVDITLPSGDSRPTPPPSVQPKDPRYKECDLTDVKKLLNDIKACACKKNKVVKTQTYGPAKGRTVALPSGTAGVVVTSTPTSGVKYQVSEGNAPDVYYVGWASFGVRAPAGERIPLNFGSVGLEAPENAIAFSYSLVYDSQASLTVYYLEDES